MHLFLSDFGQWTVAKLFKIYITHVFLIFYYVSLVYISDLDEM